MSANPHIVDADELRRLSGKKSASAVRRWASSHGIRVVDGKSGPWTTLEAVNKALGVSSANEAVYKADEIL